MVMLPVRHDDAGVARGGAAGVGDARRVRMMQAWQEVAQPVSMAPGAARKCRRGKRWRSRCRWLKARHDDAGVARGGAAGVDGSRRVTMMQAWQEVAQPVSVMQGASG